MTIQNEKSFFRISKGRCNKFNFKRVATFLELCFIRKKAILGGQISGERKKNDKTEKSHFLMKIYPQVKGYGSEYKK